MTRRTRSRTARIRIFDASGGMCHICGAKIHIGEDWQLDHAIPLACGGSDTDDNLFPAHTACHSGKTKTDVKDAAKIKRVRARHLGVKKQQSLTNRAYVDGREVYKTFGGLRYVDTKEYVRTNQNDT